LSRQPPHKDAGLKEISPFDRPTQKEACIYFQHINLFAAQKMDVSLPTAASIK
jgi:hypothetical protein